MSDEEFADRLSAAQQDIRTQVAQQWPAKYDRVIPRQDMTQMVNVAAWTSPAKREITPASFDSWLRDLVLSTLRSAWVRLERNAGTELPLSELSDPPLDGHDAIWLRPASMAAAREMKERVHQAIAGLSKSDQKILAMRFAGEDFKSVARELHRRPATVRQAFHRAKRLLQNYFSHRGRPTK